MPRRPQVDNTAVVEYGRHRLDLIGILRLGKYQIQLKGAFIAVFDALSKVARLDGKLIEDALYLLPLLGLQHSYLVIRLDDRHRLDKDRSAAGRGIVDETCYLAPVFVLDGDNVSAVPLCDYILLQEF